MTPRNSSMRRFDRLRPKRGLPITPAMWGCRRSPCFAEEAGFALIEALIGAVVLMVIALATLSAIDRAQKTSGFAKNKSVAGALAEQDQARLRGLPADSLSNYVTNHVASRTVTINGLNYTVASTVDWIRDSTGGTLSCTNNSSQADYLKLTSTVSANSIRPVTLTSLAAPPLAYSSSRGTLVVQVNDGATVPAGVQGVNVNISGPTSQSGTTNALGCVVFGFIPAGAYNVAIAKSGFVDPSGVASPSVGNKTVTGGNLTTQPFTYDQAGSIPVSFETDISATSTPVLSRSRGYNAAAKNTAVPAQFRATPAASDAVPPVATVNFDTLFPFRGSKYNVYAGRCQAANPETAIPNAAWFTTAGQIGYDDAVLVPPGGASSPVTVRQPGLELRVKDSAGTYRNGARVVITPQATTCMPASITAWTTAKNTVTNTDGWVTKDPYDFGGSTGNVTYDPGLPFGSYKVCAEYNFGTTASPQWRKSSTQPTVTLNNAAGNSFTDLSIPNSGGYTASPQC
jgi:Tfp pilus assembly protein PilV